MCSRLIVSIFGLFPVLVSCHYELSMFQLCLCDCGNYPVYLVPVFWVWFRLVYSLLPGVSCLCFLPCPALSCLDVIKYYYLSLRPRLRVPVPPSCVHRDRRPDQTVSGAHSPRFVFRFQRSFDLFQSVCVCLSRGKEIAARNPAIAHCKKTWEFGGIATSPLAASPHARRSREISGLPSSRVAAPPGAPFAGYHATGPPLTQCPPARLWLNARRIAADSSPPDRRNP